VTPADALSNDVATPPPPAVRQARALVLVGLIGLIALGLLWELWLAPTGAGTLALKVLPLVLCVAGIWLHRMYVYRVLSLLIWLYVMEGLLRAATERGLGQRLALLEVFLCLLLFGACAGYIRLRQRNGAAAAAAAGPP
jgi:uncharacterized membrane protein